MESEEKLMSKKKPAYPIAFKVQLPFMMIMKKIRFGFVFIILNLNEKKLI